MNLEILKNKTIVLGVTGSIAAYKMANVASMLVKQNCDVHVIMTENATKFITPTTFETLTKNPCYVETFQREYPIKVHHIELGQKTDLILVAPATANVIGKMAYGIADDMLTSTIVAATCPVVVSPAMNSFMYTNPIVQDNIKRLKRFGYKFIEPETGHLACNAIGTGKLPNEQVLVDNIAKVLYEESNMNSENSSSSYSLSGLNVLVTAGPTRESIDPVRYITNHSTGKMGYAIARQAAAHGANVTLVTGPVSIEPPCDVTTIPITTADEMYNTVMEHFPNQDIVIKAAAVADYRPKEINAQKVKKSDGNLFIELERTKDILAELGSMKKASQCVCGFSMETENVLENSKKKLIKKNVDMIASNCLFENGAGFGTDTNHLTLITPDKQIDLDMLSKDECADKLLQQLKMLWEEKNK